jgi:hypothetical protein
METNDAGDYRDKVDEILGSDLADIDKLKQGYGMVTAGLIEHAHREADLARATHDGEARIKVQIKMETLKYARQIFDHWYTLVTGRRAWDE